MAARYISHKAEVLAAISKAQAQALEVIGGTAEGYCKNNCPVQTGTLRNSIAHEPRGDNAVAIGTDMDYAPYVEYGHNQEPGRYVPALGKRLVASHVAAHPFMEPGVMGHSEEWASIIKKIMSKI